MKDFKEVLESDGVYVFDGAVGTRFYDKGIYINRSYDELNLVAPDLVREDLGDDAPGAVLPGVTKNIGASTADRCGGAQRYRRGAGGPVTGAAGVGGLAGRSGICVGMGGAHGCVP